MFYISARHESNEEQHIVNEKGAHTSLRNGAENRTLEHIERAQEKLAKPNQQPPENQNNENQLDWRKTK